MKDEPVAAVYSRKSRFTGTGDSVENQIETCCEYVKMHFRGQNVRIEIFEDEGFSGSTMKRPAMEKLLRKAAEGDIDILVCYRLDRVSRSVSDFADFIDKLNIYGIKFISVRENFDTTTQMGRAMIHIASVFAQLERETIAERITDNMLSLARGGRWLGGETPTGYMSESVKYSDNEGRTRYYHRLSVIPEEAELVELIFNNYIRLGSIAELRRYLERQKLLSKNGLNYGSYSLKFILENPVYCCADKLMHDYLFNNGYSVYSEECCFDGCHALIAYNRSNENKRNGVGRQNKRSDWIIAVGEHAYLIESSKWICVQKMLAEAVEYNISRKSRSSGACLSGLSICKECGSLMRPKTSGTINKDGSKRFYYMCIQKSYSRSISCNQINVQGNTMDEVVCSKVSEIYCKFREIYSANNKDCIQRVNKVMQKIGFSISESMEIINFSNKIWSSMSANQKTDLLSKIIRKIEWDGSKAVIYFRSE